MKIEIPELHPSLNVWAIKWHPFKRNKEKKRWTEMIGWLCKGKKPFKGAVSVRIDWYFPDKRRRDYDNYAPKFLLDGLVVAGLIEDDSTKIIQKLDDHNFHLDRENPRTEVIITSI